MVSRLGLGCLAKRDRALRWVLIPAGTWRAIPAIASASVSTKRDQTLRPGVCPTPEAVNSDSPDGCPAGCWANASSNRRTGPMTKGFINSVGPVRAACGEPGRIRSGSIPSWETLPESESSVRSYPGNRDRAPRFLWSETLVKPNNAMIISDPCTAKRGLVAPHAQPAVKVFTKVDTRPATTATGRGKGPAWPAAEAYAF